MVCLDINVGVGVDELSASSIDAFPNPTPGNLTVSSKQLLGSQNWMLIDMNGSIISKGQTTPSNGQHQLNFYNAATGSYILIIGEEALPIQIEK